MDEKDISQKITDISTRSDLADFVALLRSDLTASPERWENVSLAAYLEAMAAWLKDTEGHERFAAHADPSWQQFANILFASSIYE